MKITWKESRKVVRTKKYMYQMLLFFNRPDLLIRAARHYEGAEQILRRQAVFTAKKVLDHYISLSVLFFFLSWATNATEKCAPVIFHMLDQIFTNRWEGQNCSDLVLSSFPGSSLLPPRRGPWLRLVTCVCEQIKSAQRLGSRLNFLNIEIVFLFSSPLLLLLLLQNTQQ